MQLDQLAGEREAQAGALEVLPRLGADLLELHENPLQVLRRDPDAGIRHCNLQNTVPEFRHNLDTAMLSELDRIAHEIDQNLPQASAIGLNVLR